MQLKSAFVVLFSTYFFHITATTANQKKPKPPKIFVDAEVSAPMNANF